MPIYTVGKEYFSEGDWNNDSHYAILVTENYTFSASHTTLADLVAFECTDADYTPQDIANQSSSVVGTTVELHCDDIEFNNGNPANITAAGIAILEGTVSGKASGDRLVLYQSFNTNGTNQTVIGATLQVKIPATGIVRFV